MKSEFKFAAAPWVPYKDFDPALLARLRRMGTKDYEKHPNPEFRIKVLDNAGVIDIADRFAQIKQSDEQNRKFVMICGNPNPNTYMPLAELINLYRINCRNVYCFTMDEWADEASHIAPETYRAGFTYSFLKYFYEKIDPALRMPRKNIYHPTDANMADYSKMLFDVSDGGNYTLYSGPGWTGHIAFIDPCPELCGCETIEEYLEQPAQVVTLHPLTIAQNSLHGVFGCSGDVGNVPPKAATLGPLDVKRAARRIEEHGLTTMGTFSSWQRMVSRLICHGPVSPMVPGSILQLFPTNVYVASTIAQPIECEETVGY
ncbi:MAG: hypothetical protein PHR35_06615 [Kiritimatiellae bacterium]|nr:hypothetical protein [Kiritimatiellia bacterium]